MTDTKDLIKRLDAFIKNESYWIVPTGCTLFEEIKQRLEQQHQHEQNILNYGTDEPEEKQPQPDEFVEDLIYASYNFHKGVEFKSKASERIRTLLQSRPSVTRGEIEKVVWSGKNTEGRISDLLVLFKSKGIEVEEKP